MPALGLELLILCQQYPKIGNSKIKKFSFFSWKTCIANQLRHFCSQLERRTFYGKILNFHFLNSPIFGYCLLCLYKNSYAVHACISVCGTLRTLVAFNHRNMRNQLVAHTNAHCLRIHLKRQDFLTSDVSVTKFLVPE